MYTEYFGPIDQEGLSGLEMPSRKLQQGQLIAFPTETVYGLGAIVLNIQALKRLYQVKNRAEGHSLPVQVANIDQLKFVVADIPHEAQILAKHFLPGPLTLILKKSPILSDLITGGKSTVAVRLCSNPIARRLVELTGCPLAVPSANITGSPSSTKASHVLEDFNGQIDGIVDGGEVEYGVESTLISLENPACPTLLRFGVVSQKDIETVLNRKLVIHPSALSLNRSLSFDKLRFTVRLFSCWDEMKIYLKLSATSRRMIMSSSSPPFGETYFQLSSRNLYEGLRFAEREGYSEVLVHYSPEIKENPFLLNKLKQIAQT